jgi:catechol 2,3-dioxygenase-like lactoylglutathione lyase family enzyme
MAVKVTRLFHIEIVVPDAEATYQFLHKVFGAQKVEEDIATYLDGLAPDARVIHVGIGGVVLQLVQPVREFESWYNQLKDKGPSVHNLTFLVEDLENAVKTLEHEGAPSIWSIELEKSHIFGKGAGTGPMPVHMVDAVDKVGFKIELAESPGEGQAPPPFFTAPQGAPVQVSPLAHIEIVVDDVEKSYTFLNRAFGAQSVEEHIPAYLEERLPGTRIRHVEVGGVVIQFVQPTEELPSWYHQLKEKGPSVHNLTFLVDDLENALKTLEKEGSPSIWSIGLEKHRLFGDQAKGDLPVYMMDTLDKVGFRFEMAEMPRGE